MLSLTEAQLLGWLMMLLQPAFRVLGLFSSAPLLSSRTIPRRVRVAAGLAIAVAAAPLTGAPPFDPGDPRLPLLLAGEALTGLAIGLAVRIVISSIDLAGELIGLQMGLSFAGFFDPSAGQGNAVGRLLTTLGLAFFVAADGPTALIAATVQSLQALPVLPAGNGPGVVQWLGALPLGRLLAQVFEMAVLLALPVVTMLLFINLALGIMARVAPQLNLFAIGFPVTLGAGMLMLSVVLPGLTGPFHEAWRRALDVLAVAR